MITRAEDIDVLFAKDIQCIFSLRVRRVIQSVAFYPISSIDEDEIRAVIAGLFLEPLS